MKVNQYASDMVQWAEDMLVYLDQTSDAQIKADGEAAKTLSYVNGKVYVVNMQGMNDKTIEFYNSWVKTREDLGALKSIDKEEVRVSDETGTLCTIAINATYETRTCSFELVIDDDFNLDSGAINPTYTTGEKMEKPISTENPTDEFLTVLKSNSENKAYVQKFRFSGWNAKTYRSISEVEFPDPSIINENTKFAVCQNRPYVYIASGNVLYVYNHKDNTVKPLRSDFGRTIRDIAVCPTNYERLGIALENADDTSKSDFMVLDVSVVGDGKTLEGTH